MEITFLFKVKFNFDIFIGTLRIEFMNVVLPDVPSNYRFFF